MATRYKDLITVLISSSPIPSHPSTHIIDETLASVRYHLPDSKIIIMQDGIRPEQLDHEARYNIYFRALAAKIANESDRDIVLWPFPDFLHQAGMTMRVIQEVITPLILFVEHDTPLVDRWIDWGLICDTVITGATNHVRLHYDAEIHADHKHLMEGKLGEHFIKTVQWHQRPHIALTQWYENILLGNFNEKSRTFIEDKIYSPVSCADWSAYRLTIYDPQGDGKNMKCSRDINGRAGEPKFDMTF